MVWPKRSDPRLRLAVVIIALQVLGQTVLRFKLSIAQILVTVAVCAAVDFAITYWRQRVLIWPASALLTGNSTAFILRVNGTRPGDWWSLNGIEWFVLAALIGILSKYAIRVSGRHLFNPSNLGLVVIFLAVGAEHVFPQYLYWGPLSAPVIAALVVILAGALWVLWPLRMWPMVAAFLVWFGVLVAAEAVAGRCFLATWHRGPVCGVDYWINIVTSPELLVFTFFMISDPRTTPRLRGPRIAYGILIAALAAGFLLIQPSEFGVKVAILGSLTVVCALVPLFDRPLAELRWQLLAIRPTIVPGVAMAAVIAATVPAAIVALASNPLVVAIDGENSPSSHHGPLPANVPQQ